METKQFKCDICITNFALKSNLKQHVGTVHEGKKHVTAVHEGKKQFKCDICNGNFGEKSNLITM